jgi:hypothetical protein
VPAHGDRGPARADHARDEETDLCGDDVLDGGRVGERGEEGCERRRDRSHRSIRLSAAFVEEQPRREQEGRAREREGDPCLDADPATVDCDEEEEDDADEDREAPQDREDPPAEEVLEGLAATAHRGRGRHRRGRGRLGCGCVHDGWSGGGLRRWRCLTHRLGRDRLDGLLEPANPLGEVGEQAFDARQALVE